MDEGTRYEQHWEMGEYITQRVASVKIGVDRLRWYITFLQFYMVFALYVSDRQMGWEYLLIIPLVVLFWTIDKKYIHPAELKKLTQRNKILIKMSEDIECIKNDISHIKRERKHS